MSTNRCPSCSTAVDPSWSFCPKCNLNLKEEAGSQESLHLGDSGWLRGSDEIAAHINPSGGRGLTARLKGETILVEEGCRGLLFLNGKLAQTLNPGKHKVGGLKERLESKGIDKSSVVMVRTADLDVEINQAGLRTAEEIPVNVKTKITFRVGDPDIFFVNMLQGREGLAVPDLRALLYEESRNALEEAVHGLGVDKLRSDLAIKRKLEVDVEQHLTRVLSRKGLDLIHFSAVEFTQEELETVRDALGEAEMDQRRLAAERKGVAAEDSRVDLLLEKQEVADRVRRAINAGRVSESNSQQEMEDYLHEVQKKGILRDVELNEFQRAFDEKSADHEAARGHLLEKLGLERVDELKSLEQEHEQELTRRGLLFDIESSRREHEFDLERFKGTAAAEREVREGDHGQEMQEAQDALRLQDLKRRQELEHGHIADQHDIERLKAEEEMATHRARLEHDHLTDQMKAEAAADVARTQAYGNLSSDQILAIQAAESPEAAQALAEKFKAEASAGRKEQERIDAMNERLVDQAQEHARQAFDFGKEALGIQRDAAIGTAQGSRGGQAKQGHSGGTPKGTPPAEKKKPAAMIVCPKCRYKIDESIGARACPNCGHVL